MGSQDGLTKDDVKNLDIRLFIVNKAFVFDAFYPLVLRPF